MSSRRPGPIALEHRGFVVHMTRKDVASLRLRVQPHTGEIRLSVPRSVPLDRVRAFLDGNLTWLSQAQARMQALPVPQTPTLRDVGSVPLWGSWIPVDLATGPRASAVVDDGRLLVTGPDEEGHRRAVEAFYRRELRELATSTVRRWEEVVDRRASELKFRRMKTRWGTCNIRSRAITLNLSLAERDPRLLEYVVVHELTHLRVADHGPRFQGYMDLFLPDWRQRRREINSRPANGAL